MSIDTDIERAMHLLAENIAVQIRAQYPYIDLTTSNVVKFIDSLQIEDELRDLSCSILKIEN